MYRHRAPVLIHVLADGRSARRGALGGSAAPGLQHLNSVSAARAASAHLVGPGGFSQRVGEEDGLMVAVLFLSHPGMNLFFQFWHWFQHALCQRLSVEGVCGGVEQVPQNDGAVHDGAGGQPHRVGHQGVH